MATNDSVWCKNENGWEDEGFELGLTSGLIRVYPTLGGAGCHEEGQPRTRGTSTPQADGDPAFLDPKMMKAVARSLRIRPLADSNALSEHSMAMGNLSTVVSLRGGVFRGL